MRSIPCLMLALLLTMTDSHAAAAEVVLADCVGTWVTEQGGYRISLSIQPGGGAELTSTLVVLGMANTEQGMASVDHDTLTVRILDDADFTRELGERRYRIVSVTNAILEVIWDGPVVPVKFQRQPDAFTG